VAVFTALMLCVCFWAAALYTVDKGVVDPNHLPAYLQTETDKNLPHHTDTTSEDLDTVPVLAPVWDSTFKGQDIPLDSISAESLRVVSMAKETVYVDTDHESILRENLGLAHTHINGQTLPLFRLWLYLPVHFRPGVAKETALLDFRRRHTCAQYRAERAGVLLGL